MRGVGYGPARETGGGSGHSQPEGILEEEREREKSGGPIWRGCVVIIPRRHPISAFYRS